MTRIHPLFAGVLLLAMLPAVSAAPPGEGKAKKLYCWNENGHKVCGDALPATAVNSARTEISARSGMATGQVARALTADESAAAATQAEAARQAAIAAEAKQRLDMAMVESYASETDLRRAYENRIELSEGTVKASRLGVTGLRQSLLSLLRRAGASELDGKPVAKPLAVNIQGQHAEGARHRGTGNQQLARAARRFGQHPAATEFAFAAGRHLQRKKGPIGPFLLFFSWIRTSLRSTSDQTKNPARKREAHEGRYSLKD